MWERKKKERKRGGRGGGKESDTGKERGRGTEWKSETEWERKRERTRANFNTSYPFSFLLDRLLFNLPLDFFPLLILRTAPDADVPGSSGLGEHAFGFYLSLWVSTSFICSIC